MTINTSARLSCVAVLLLALLSCTHQTHPSDSHLKLWYNQPANSKIPDNLSKAYKDDPEWLKALPLGNGSLGLMVFGDVNQERIQLNEESMWSGSLDDNDNPASYPAIAKIRELLFQNKYREATALAQKTQICKGAGTNSGRAAKKPYGSFQTLGDLWLDFQTDAPYTDYHRELDIDNAVVRITYTQHGVRFKRELFVNYPEQVAIIKLSADQAGKISFQARMNRPERFETQVKNDQLIMKGHLRNGKGGNGLQYMARLAALNKNGTVQYENNMIKVKNADEVTLMLTASTDYVLSYPKYKGRDYKTITKNHLNKARKMPYQALLKNHIQDYQKYFNRVTLKLTASPDTIPTDVRLKHFKSKPNDPHLETLLFQYGRYLLISSSRPGTLPANLQGLWSNKTQTPWNGDYHTNVNVEMNYWPAETTNLSELQLPLIDLMASLQQPGAKTAKIHYHANGWVLHPVTNAWGFTSPGGNIAWGMHLGGGAWLTSHLMEHYYFTLDKAFLERRFPILKGSTQFYMDWLITDPKTGKLVSGPSSSPENTFIAPDGSRSQITIGPAHDQQVIWQLFKNFIDASKALGKEDAFFKSVVAAQAQLAKPQIGADGRLLEWQEPFKEVEPGHRHISHLFGLHPGYQIDIENTPQWAAAAEKSLNYRVAHNGGHTGWSAAWLINQYARLGKGEKAKKSLNMVLTKSTAPNMFGKHPPFQIDANFGTTAGIAEMLLQSQSGAIRLLPALPLEWQTGEVKGLCARGGFVVDMKWQNGRLSDVSILSKQGGVCHIEYRNKKQTLETEPSKTYVLKFP